MKLPLIITSIFICSAAFGQNLIRNYSFEDLRWPNSEYPCPTSLGGISLTEYWKSAANGPVDYFHECSNAEWANFRVPVNLLGNQVPFQGNAYANVATYSLIYTDIREYLTQELEEPLSTGQGYSISFRVSLVDSSNFAISGLGSILTTDDTRYWDDEDFFNVTPHIENHIDSLLDDKLRWMEVSGQFVANGEEKFITIGCFNQDVDENIQQVSSNSGGVYNWDFSSYYIDGVVLQEDNSIGITELPEILISVYPNPTSNVLTIESAFFMNDIVVYDMFGRIVMETSCMNQKRIDISIDGLETGFYSLVLVDGSGRRLMKRILKK